MVKRKVFPGGYMDVRPGSATRAKMSTSTLAAPAPAAGDFGLAVLGHAERALHVLGALGPSQADLLRRRLDPFERSGRDRHAACRRNGRRQRRGPV
jgi:hypothetical protein